MVSFRRSVSVALSAVIALSLLLLSTAAHADKPWRPSPPAPPPVTVTVLTAAPAAVKTTLQLTPPTNGSVYVYDGASPVAALTSKGSLQIEPGKEYTFVAQRGGKTIWSAPIAASGSALQMVWVDGKSAPVIGAAPVTVTVPAPRPVVLAPPPPVVTPAPGPGHHGHNHAAPTAMSDAAFDTLLALVEEKAFDSTRMEVLKTASATAYFSVAQVSKLLAKLSFDSNRLEALKAIHTRVVDRENAVLLSKSFTFSSNQTEALKLFQTPAAI